MSVRVCVLGSGSKGNCTLIATERTRLLVDAGFSKRATYNRLAAASERPEGIDGLIISHEHVDHVNGLKSLALGLKIPVYLTGATRQAIPWDSRLKAVETISAGEKFTIGDITVAPFSIPHDAVDPVAFTFQAEGIKIGLVTDLGYVPELVKQHTRGCHCLIIESNHDLDMLKVGPYPWFVKQRVMSRHGHLSNHATAEFLSEDYDGAAQVLVLAHLSEKNNHPGLAHFAATRALEKRGGPLSAELHLASQSEPTEVFHF
ncbi:MAG: MBL fold metallo-hydrolase [Acidobacteria bacterium]|nr:MBL fold metallo-hydrolase [Acidobacteriota bacterium]